MVIKRSEKTTGGKKKMPRKKVEEKEEVNPVNAESTPTETPKRTNPDFPEGKDTWADE
jgi:hypothetical protein